MDAVVRGLGYMDRVVNDRVLVERYWLTVAHHYSNRIARTDVNLSRVDKTVLGVNTYY